MPGLMATSDSTRTSACSFTLAYLEKLKKLQLLRAHFHRDNFVHQGRGWELCQFKDGIHTTNLEDVFTKDDGSKVTIAVPDVPDRLLAEELSTRSSVMVRRKATAAGSAVLAAAASSAAASPEWLVINKAPQEVVTALGLVAIGKISSAHAQEISRSVTPQLRYYAHRWLGRRGHTRW